MKRLAFCFLLSQGALACSPTRQLRPPNPPQASMPEMPELDEPGAGIADVVIDTDVPARVGLRPEPSRR